MEHCDRCCGCITCNNTDCPNHPIGNVGDHRHADHQCGPQNNCVPHLFDDYDVSDDDDDDVHPDIPIEHDYDSEDDEPPPHIYEWTWNGTLARIGLQTIKDSGLRA
jgi:hypothetical protein